MKQNYSKPQVEVIEMELSSGVLTDTSTVTVPTGGEGDNSRSTDDQLFFED